MNKLQYNREERGIDISPGWRYAGTEDIAAQRKCCDLPAKSRSRRKVQVCWKHLNLQAAKIQVWSTCHLNINNKATSTTSCPANNTSFLGRFTPGTTDGATSRSQFGVWRYREKHGILHVTVRPAGVQAISFDMGRWDRQVPGRFPGHELHRPAIGPAPGNQDRERGFGTGSRGTPSGWAFLNLLWIHEVADCPCWFR